MRRLPMGGVFDLVGCGCDERAVRVEPRPKSNSALQLLASVNNGLANLSHRPIGRLPRALGVAGSGIRKASADFLARRHGSVAHARFERPRSLMWGSTRGGRILLTGGERVRAVAVVTPPPALSMPIELGLMLSRSITKYRGAPQSRFRDLLPMAASAHPCVSRPGRATR